ncbi:MAG TPA: hypothetical protein VH762_05000 [Gemmatimonadaceae bacterium]|jgi:hypothetical protein
MRRNVIGAGWPEDSALASFSADSYLREELDVETHGPLGTLWVGLGLGAYFLALTWLNLLLGHMLTPLFLIPITWLQDALQQRRQRKAK